MDNGNGTRVLVRSQKGRMLAGVCAGVAGYFDMDVTLVRVIVAVVSVITGGAGVLAYLAAWLIIPAEGEKTSVAQNILGKKQNVLLIGGLGCLRQGLRTEAGVPVTRLGSAVISQHCTGEESQDFAYGRFLAGGLRQRHMRLDLVAVAAAVFVLHHVASFSEIGDDAVGAPLRDAQAVRDVTQPDAGIAGDTQQHTAVIGQESPARHAREHTRLTSYVSLIS
jgi:phage shock protein C